MKPRILVGPAVIALIIAAAVSQRALGQAAAKPSSKQAAPIFEVDPEWPKLPNNWGMGVTSSVAVDQRDHAWILHRPRVGVPADKTAAPPVLEFDAAGKFVQGWGGPGDGYDWPDSEHGIYVDDKDSVWIGGSSRMGAAVCEGGRCSRGDDMLLKFTPKGKFVMQIGHRDQSSGSADQKNVHAATDVFVYRKTNELFVSDGYEGPGAQGNCRVIVFDAGTGAFKRMWGAFGNPPSCLPPRTGRGRGAGRGAAAAGDAAPPPAIEEGPGPRQLGTVHGIELSNDGFVYVCDRENKRIQVFTLAGKYVNQVFINRSGTNGSAAGLAFSPDKDQKFMYVADYGNSHVVVLDRKPSTFCISSGNGARSQGTSRASTTSRSIRKATCTQRKWPRATAPSGSCSRECQRCRERTDRVQPLCQRWLFEPNHEARFEVTVRS